MSTQINRFQIKTWDPSWQGSHALSAEDRASEIDPDLLGQDLLAWSQVKDAVRQAWRTESRGGCAKHLLNWNPMSSYGIGNWFLQEKWAATAWGPSSNCHSHWMQGLSSCGTRRSGAWPWAMVCHCCCECQQESPNGFGRLSPVRVAEKELSMDNRHFYGK